jgi:hypothetical protein
MSREELKLNLESTIESYDNPVELAYSQKEIVEALTAIINQHVNDVLAEQNPKSKMCWGCKEVKV